jgi:hypothetical protein
MRQVDAQFAEGYNELSVFHNFAVEYIDARTEAIFLRDAGWDVVPLLLERPALAIVAGGHVVAVRDWRGWLTIHPERRGTLNHLFADLDRAEEKLLHLREVLDLYPDTKERLVKYAYAMWKRARKAAAQNYPARTCRTPASREMIGAHMRVRTIARLPLEERSLPRPAWRFAASSPPPGLRGRRPPGSRARPSRSSSSATPTPAPTPASCGPTAAATCASTSTAAPSAA